MYDEGAYGSQPAALVECFGIMEQTLDKVETFRREQEAKRRGKPKRG